MVERLCWWWWCWWWWWWLRQWRWWCPLLCWDCRQGLNITSRETSLARQWLHNLEPHVSKFSKKLLPWINFGHNDSRIQCFVKVSSKQYFWPIPNHDVCSCKCSIWNLWKSFIVTWSLVHMFCNMRFAIYVLLLMPCYTCFAVYVLLYMFCYICITTYVLLYITCYVCIATCVLLHMFCYICWTFQVLKQAVK